MRLFIAIQLDENMKNAVCRLQDSFRAQGVSGSYTPRENLHLTLAFIGEYNDPDAVLDVMERICFPPFSLSLDRLGCFDALWWLGVKDSPELEKLVHDLRRALAEEGIDFDGKKFKAHITFLRRARYSGRSISDMRIEKTRMQVRSVSLMRSTRGKNSMIYTELGSVHAR